MNHFELTFLENNIFVRYENKEKNSPGPIRRRARSASKRYVLLIILHFVSRMNEFMCKCCQVYSSKFVLCLYSGCLCVAVY